MPRGPRPLGVPGQAAPVVGCSAYLFDTRSITVATSLGMGFVSSQRKRVVHEVVMQRDDRRGGARRDPELAVDVLHMVVRGALGDRQSLSDLPIGHAAGQQSHHV